MNSELQGKLAKSSQFRTAAALHYVAQVGRWLFVSALLLAPAISSAATPTSITSCETISASGFYAVANALNSATGDCLVVAASDVTLNLNGNNITGSGSGAGIHVLATLPLPSTCTTATATENRCKPKPLKNVFILGQSAVISGFASGIEDDARRVTGDSFSVVGNGAGIFLNGARGGNFMDFGAEGNTSGVYVSGGKNNAFSFFDASNNSQYGIWVQGSDHNIVGTFSAISNSGASGAGVFVGCSPTNPANTSCTDSSGNNLVFDGYAANNAYGIAVGAGASGSNVANNFVSSDSIDDLFDGNANCGTNLWFADFGFTTNSPASCTE